MQHEDREERINTILDRLIKDLLPETQKRIIKDPYKPYNPDVILDIMGEYSIQRRTAKEWLICAQIKLVKIMQKKKP